MRSSAGIDESMPSIYRAAALREELILFAQSGILGKELALQKQTFSGAGSGAGDICDGALIDWFVFDWANDSGDGVIDLFLASKKDLSAAERRLLLEWESSTNGLFAICGRDGERAILKEVGTANSVTAHITDRDHHQAIEAGRFLLARLLPAEGGSIISGPHLTASDIHTADEMMRIADATGVLVSPAPEEREEDPITGPFAEFFGTCEIDVPSSEIGGILENLRDHLRSLGIRGPACTESPALEELVRAVAPIPEVTLLCDEFEGLVILPEFRRFKQIFEDKDPNGRIPGWRELVWRYIEDPDIPMVAFEYVAERCPEHLESRLRTVLGKPDFSLEHLYAMLLHYKDPVDGLEDLKDEAKLWDFLDGKALQTQQTASAPGGAEGVRAARPGRASGAPGTVNKEPRTHSARKRGNTKH